MALTTALYSCSRSDGMSTYSSAQHTPEFQLNSMHGTNPYRAYAAFKSLLVVAAMPAS